MGSLKGVHRVLGGEDHTIFALLSPFSREHRRHFQPFRAVRFEILECVTPQKSASFAYMCALCHEFAVILRAPFMKSGPLGEHFFENWTLASVRDRKYVGSRW